jgi:enamine deaminase RidA (YjgF/YER057c/UK114 family)
LEENRISRIHLECKRTLATFVVVFYYFHMDIRQRLESLGIALPALSGPFGAYVPAKRVGSLIYVAGQIPMKDGKSLASGPIPSRCSVEQARVAARQCIINGLAAVQAMGPGMLEKISGVARIGGFVLSDVGFTQQPQVINAASELLIEIFGDAGRHARVSVGVNALPLEVSVEIELLLELSEG